MKHSFISVICMKSIAVARLLLVSLATLSIATSAAGATVTSLYGDKDGFGVGILPNASFTGFYPSLSKDDAEDVGTITDAYFDGDQTWSHVYDSSGLGAIGSAQLEIFSYAQGWHGISNVYFDDVLVGQLTDGDNSDRSLGTNWARLDTFDLLSFGFSLDGSNSIRVDTASPNDDRWALDYSELRISTSVTSVTSVPEPTSLALALLGLVGLKLARPRK